MITIIPAWILGVSFSISSSCLGSLGKVLLKYCHLYENDKDTLKEHEQSLLLLPLLSRYTIHWLVKTLQHRFPIQFIRFLSYFLVIFINPVLSTLSYAFAAQVFRALLSQSPVPRLALCRTDNCLDLFILLSDPSREDNMEPNSCFHLHHSISLLLQ